MEQETLLAEARYTAGVYGNKPAHFEIDFYIVAPDVSMNLSAMAVCTKHGLCRARTNLLELSDLQIYRFYYLNLFS